MVEFEKKGINKAKVVLTVFVILAIILTASNILVYVNLKNQINGLETENTTLHGQMGTLQTEKSNLTRERNDLSNQVDSLTAVISQLEDEIDWLNSEYDLYVTDHHYSDSEYAMLYNEVQFQFYYVKPEEQKLGVYNLDDELSKLEWTEPYQAGVFDCSEMSACLEWFLENRGWHAKIYVGDSPFGSGKHAWLIVETSVGKYMPVESTNLEVVWWSNPNFDNYWEYDYRFETIQDAVVYGESGYDWWEFGFSPLECS